MSSYPAPKAGMAMRMRHIRPFHVMQLLARAQALEAAGRSIIHMEIGEPDFPTARPIVQAGVRALHDGHTHYTPAAGLPALREAVARFYQQRYGCDIAPQRVVITTGASAALQLICGVLIDPGDRVLMADPGYPCNANFVRLFGGEPHCIPVDAASEYQLNRSLLRKHWDKSVAGAWLGSPSNPTGTLIAEPELRAMIDYCREKSGFVIVDEIYHGLTYETSPESAAAMSDDVFVVNSFSKYFGMTGWRLGWLIAPERFVPEIEKLAQNIYLAPPTPAQHAALTALQPATIDILENHREAFKRRRDFLVPALRELGFDIPVQPQGAFYIYANCARLTDDSHAFSMRLLEDYGVAIAPGIDFGSHRAEQHVRFAYTTSIEKLRQGVARLAKVLL